MLRQARAAKSCGVTNNSGCYPGLMFSAEKSNCERQVVSLLRHCLFSTQFKTGMIARTSGVLCTD